MRIELNGAPRTIEPTTTLGSLVDGEVAARRGVAVAVDGEVVPRDRWDTTHLHDDACVEIVAAVQGG